MTKGLVFWFTGLSGSGKTTIATVAKNELEQKGYSVLILDGDNVRASLHTNLGFTSMDIKINNELIAKLCQSEREKYDVILVAIISPYSSSRREARTLLNDNFFEIYFSADLKTVVERDVKGLYMKARNNEISNLIGYSDNNIYEPPTNPDFILNSSTDSIEKSAHEFLEFITKQLL